MKLLYVAVVNSLAVSAAFAQTLPGMTPSADAVAFSFTTLFTDETFTATVALSWEDAEEGATPDMSTLYYRTTLNGKPAQEGSVDLNENRNLPSEVEVLSASVGEAGTVTVSVEVSLDAAFSDPSSAEAEAQAIASGVSLLPLIAVLLLAVTMRKVELSLFLGIWLGACIVTGSLKQGFVELLQNYILNAASEFYNVWVVLFTLFLSGLVGMMLRSGGIAGLTTVMLRFAKSARSAQLTAFASGLLVFFDDYANCLVVGATMRPITDERMVSREKIAFIVDATAAPIASLLPISSWVGYEVSLIQAELDKIVTDNGGVAPDGLDTNGFSVFLSSIAYRYYPIFLVVLQLTLSASRRDFGPMLTAERKVVVFSRRDGGDGAFTKGEELAVANAPLRNTPLRAWNMLVPVLLLVFLIIYTLVDSGVQASDDGASLITIIQASDSYVALIQGTMGTAMLTLIFYALQYKKNGKVVMPRPRDVWVAVAPRWITGRRSSSSNNNSSATKKVAGHDGEEANLETVEGYAEPLLGPFESSEAFLRGMTMVFPAIVVLVLAWATGDIMTAIGADRLFSDAIINGDFQIGALPAVTFILSAFIALATGTSWGTMAIVFPLVTKAAWVGSDGDLDVFNGTIGAVLAGAVLGDHCSPISDTTLLSSIATRCDLMAHVITQAPYALAVGLISVLLGYLPVGLGDYSTGVGILLGVIVTILLAFGLGAPVVSASGRFDPLTELYMRFHKGSELHDLKARTRRFAAEGGLERDLGADGGSFGASEADNDNDHNGNDDGEAVEAEEVAMGEQETDAKQVNQV